MAKEKKRKPKRIAHPRQPEVDDDLHELASILDEHRLDQNVSGWFTIPWRDGWNAVGLAYACFRHNFDDVWESTREREVANWLERGIQRRGIPSDRQEDYWQAGEYLQATFTDGVSPYLFAALRCLQVLIANSSGGGHVYNYILKLAFDKTEPSCLFEEDVLEHRCRDAIGTSAVMDHTINDRKRRAFAIAWKRGLFHAAYSIEPINNV